MSYATHNSNRKTTPGSPIEDDREGRRWKLLPDIPPLVCAEYHEGDRGKGGATEWYSLATMLT